MRVSPANLARFFAATLGLFSALAHGGVVGVVVDGGASSVGEYSSLQLNGGNPVISYWDSTNFALKLATCTGNCQSATPTWQIVTVDPAPTTGTYTSLVLNAGNPVISYRDEGNGHVKLATCTANCQSAAPTWEIVTVDASGVPGAFTSLVLNAGNPVVSYTTSSGSNVLKLATCTANCATATPTWEIVTVDNNAVWGSLQLNGGNPVISYKDFLNDDLKLATCTANCATATPSWEIVTVVSPGNVGQYNSLVLNGGNPVISYSDLTNFDLKLATCTANCATATPTWQIVTVDSPGFVGEFTSLQLNGANPVISYYDAINNDLKLATCTANCQSATPAWRIATVEGTGARGRMTSLQLNGVDAVISHYDNAAFDLRLATVTPPAVTGIVRAGANPTNAASVDFTVTFSESVTGVDASDFTLVTSGVAGASVTGVAGSGTTYTVTVGTGSGDGTLRLDLVDDDSIGGFLPLAGLGAGNGNAAGEVYTIDKTGPSVTIDQAGGQGDPTSASPIVFTVVFSGAVSGFAASDVSFAGSTVGGTLVANVSGSGANYTVSVTGMSGSGTVVASVNANAAADAAGNTNPASTSIDNTVTFDNVQPTVTINQAAGQADPASASPVLFTAVFSEAVTGFTGSDVSFAGSTVGGTLAANVSGSGTTYTVSVTGMVGSGTVVVGIPVGAASDAAGNSSTASTSTDNTVTFDSTVPTVTINQAGAQADPTTASPIVFTVLFSEAVTGFTGADVSFAGSTAAGTLAATVTGSGASYTVSVSGMAGNGTVVASIPAARATDLAGNANLASTSTDNSVTYMGVGVTTFSAPSATGSGNITAQFTGGGAACSFSGPQFIGPPPGAPPIPPTAPPGLNVFPHGLFDFSVVNCTAGSTLTFTVTYPAALPASAVYWKYGPEPANATPHWYVLPATIAGNVATFTITDGGQGDDDLAANGTIVDQGGPGVPPGLVPQTVPTLSEWALALMALLMMMGAAGGLRRSSRHQ